MTSLAVHMIRCIQVMHRIQLSKSDQRIADSASPPIPRPENIVRGRLIPRRGMQGGLASTRHRTAASYRRPNKYSNRRAIACQPSRTHPKPISGNPTGECNSVAPSQGSPPRRAKEHITFDSTCQEKKNKENTPQLTCLAAASGWLVLLTGPPPNPPPTRIGLCQSAFPSAVTSTRFTVVTPVAAPLNSSRHTPASSFSAKGIVACPRPRGQPIL